MEPVPAQSESYENFIVRYRQNMFYQNQYESDQTFQIINEMFGVLYTPEKEVPELEFNSYSYSSIPKCYTAMDLGGLAASGITKLQDHPYLKLRGAETMVAIIDSGIDYKNTLFRNGKGTRILSIWDQNVPGKHSEEVPYGKVYSQEEINEALDSEDPYGNVPVRDEDGHGTRLAAIAAGNSVPEEKFSGAAPGAALVIVKLKPAKQYLKDFYLIPESAKVYQEDDIMLAISYVVRFAAENHMPLSICLGLGTNMGAHSGSGPLSEYIDSTAAFSQNAVSVAAGNEGAAGHHYMGNTTSMVYEKSTAELHVGQKESESGFSMEFWGESPGSYRLSVQSPTGEKLSVSPDLKHTTQKLSFVFVETRLLVNYVPIEGRTGKTLVFFRFFHPAEGIWKIEAEDRKNENGRYHLWLPAAGMISEDTRFLQPDPGYTITSPGDAENAMTVTAYDYRDGSLYLKAGRGYNTDNTVKPDFAAPGVELSIPADSTASKQEMVSGTSLSAAQTAGMAALLFEWALIRGNEPYFTGNNVKNYLRLGAIREEGRTYPNPEWGYGRLDLYHTFELLT